MNKSTRIQNLILTGILFIGALPGKQEAQAQNNWPQFRGPGSLGIHPDPQTQAPEVWGPATNIEWSREVPGMGWSSPVVWGSKIFLTTVVSQGDVEEPKKGLYFGGERPEPPKDLHIWKALCYDLESGKLLWETNLKQGAPASPRHVKNTYASETPVTDGEHLFVYFGHSGLYALDLEGAVAWSKVWDPFPMRLGWGTSASPVEHGDRVFILNDNEESSFLAAYKKENGEEIFRVDREEPSGFSTPFIWEHSKGVELVTTGVNRTRSYDLDGNLLWEYPGMSSIVIPTPFAVGDTLYLCAGYVGDRRKSGQPLKPVYAIQAGAKGDLTLEPETRSGKGVLWMTEDASSYNPTPVVYQDRFYTLWDFGFLSCLDARTGEEIYEKQRVRSSGSAGFTASPWAANGKIFCLSEDGDTYVFKAGDDFELLRVNPLDELCMATPALVGDRLIVRTQSKLISIRESVK